MTADFNPAVGNKGDRAEIKFRGRNSVGNDCEMTILIDKWFLPEIIKSFAEIARRDVAAAIGFEKRIKNAIES